MGRLDSPDFIVKRQNFTQRYALSFQFYAYRSMSPLSQLAGTSSIVHSLHCVPMSTWIKYFYKYMGSIIIIIKVKACVI